MTDAAADFAQTRRALIDSAKRAGIELYAAGSASKPWSTSLFTGSRHSAVIGAAASPLFDAWLAALPEADLPLRGMFVASVDLGDRAPDGRGNDLISIEILTVAE